MIDPESDGDVDPAARVSRLRHHLEEANYNYHVLDNPRISDAEYDGMMRELRSLEERHPELRAEDSPTNRVGGQVGRGFLPRRHPRPMLSLANAFSPEDLLAWFRRVRNLVPDALIDFVVEPKIDGLAVALTYDEGLFRVGSTRGNGIEGENVTANLRTLGDIPDRLSGEPIPKRVEVRGEVYFPIDAFQELNKRRADEGQSLFANPRNSAAGSLRQLDPEITRQRPLHFFGYAVGYADGARLESQWQILTQLRTWGFPVNSLAGVCTTIEEVQEYCERITHERERLPYEIDGAVVKINSVALQEELGAVGREPRWAIAFKFPPREATTRVLDIQINVGRTGTMNPFAVLEPVDVGGVIVRLATLHNEQDIQRKDVRIGDRVIVRRAGDVIPQVVKPIPEERDGTQKVWRMPDNCPACNTLLIRPEGEAMHRCPNLECPAQRFRWIEHFVSEPAMDIRGLGEELVRDFLDHSVIRDPADLYAVTVEQLLSLPNFKEKSANNVVQAIERSKDRPLPNVIFALGIRHVGGQTADLLSQAFGNLDALASASTDQLEATEGVGPKIAESIAAWFQGEGNRAFLERLHLAGVTWQDERSSEATGPLNGITFLITGRLDSLSRGHAEEQLKELGAKIASSVNKGVDYLIVGAEPGSKLAKAQKLGTKIRDEEWLVRLFENGAIVDA